jgi:hypothetical protein
MLAFLPAPPTTNSADQFCVSEQRICFAIGFLPDFAAGRSATACKALGYQQLYRTSPNLRVSVIDIVIPVSSD